jgi:hypothetical protein
MRSVHDCISIENVKLSSEGEDNLSKKTKKNSPSEKNTLKGGIFE